MALGFALAWGVILAAAHYVVEGGSLLRTFIVFITAGLVFLTPAFYFGRPDRRAKKFVAWGAGMLQRSPRTRPPGLSTTPVQQQSTAADATGPDDAGPKHTG
ncbi:hypothetical protein [Dactylosporangium sp. CA-092794]|uniref:hypothetical protein n=1 Tax=Dactylosporangium sp. CA-092794 TaxID=3239929 RepID=UPI003D8FEAC0